METRSKSVVRRIKVSVLSMAAVGVLYGSACTLGDLRHNVVNGTLGFVKNYTGDLWETLIPTAEELVGKSGASE